VSLYARAIVPQATLALESSLSGYEVGNVDFLTLMNNFVTILDYETNYWDQYAGLAESMARLEALVATNLIP
ncbi:MAG: TolC family protein, partial [Acidobacteria bacterium]|nr:TolC family protein [Acidobacteriota bacterium]